MDRVALGFDLGGTHLRAARVAADGRIEGRTVEAISRDPSHVMARMVELSRELGGAGVEAIGIGVPGRVDARRREVLSGGYLDLAGLHVADRLAEATGKRIMLDNDCNMALVAEMARGAARHCANVVMFTIGTGIGGAIALDGRIARGAATAGQLGHLQVVDHGERCKCGRRGCVETTSSGSALGRHLAEAGLPQETRVEHLLAEAAAGDAAAGRVLDRWILPLRAAVDSMVAALAPDLVLLGGGLGGAACRALPRAPALAQWYQCPVRVAELGEDAGLVGAGLTAIGGGEPDDRTTASFRSEA